MRLTQQTNAMQKTNKQVHTMQEVTKKRKQKNERIKNNKIQEIQQASKQKMPKTNKRNATQRNSCSATIFTCWITLTFTDVLVMIIYGYLH